MSNAARTLEYFMTFPAYQAEIIRNPDQATLRTLALEHTPFVMQTAHGNLNKISRNKARMAKYTYVIAPETAAADYSHQVIARDKAETLIAQQREFIESTGQLIAIEGYYGTGEQAVGIEWLYTPEGANIAGMQDVLNFTRESIEGADAAAQPFAPQFRIVYTPNCPAAKMPGEQAIIVDLENWTTYIMGPDYFGESKKGVLRMLCAYMYERGALVMHAGAKVVEVGGKKITVALMGLSGTGKTTTTFSKQGESTQPIQDDMITLWPQGKFTVTENGCFAKTAGLTPETEPEIYHGTVDPTAWVENVYAGSDMRYDFFKRTLSADEVSKWREVLIGTGAPEANVDRYIAGEVTAEDVVDDHGVPQDGWDFVVWNQNGRSIIPLSAIPDAADCFGDLPPVGSMGTLNRGEGPDAATPGLVRFTSPEQAAGYFMLGETSKTSAAGKERGKTRSPFTQPFFPLRHDLQATRFNEIAATMGACQMWMMNTGYIGGDQFDVDAGNALKVKIRHSSALLEHLFAQDIVWKVDPDFGYEIPDVDAPENATLCSIVPAEILEPKRFFVANGKEEQYANWVNTMKTERRVYLEKYGVTPEIIAAVCD